jgi:carbon starvation protein CstA
MDPSIVSALITAGFAFLGTAAGALGGVRASTKIMRFEIDELKKKVDKHNNLVERTYQVEGCVATVKNELCDFKQTVQQDFKEVRDTIHNIEAKLN